MSRGAVAERRARKREERGRIAGNTFVLDMFGPHVGETATRDEVCRVLRIDYRDVLRNICDRHGDELAADGWDRAAGTFTRRAIVRVALLVRPSVSPRAGRIAKAARLGKRLISFRHGARSQQCSSILNRAYELAEEIRDADPGEVWADLNKVDRHTLQGMAVALAALVDVDTPGVARWLRSMGGDGGSVAGLQRLVPTRETSDGLPLSVLDQIEADDEMDGGEVE